MPTADHIHFDGTRSSDVVELDGRVKTATVHSTIAAVAAIPVTVATAAAAIPVIGPAATASGAAAVLRLILLHSRAYGHSASAAQSVGIWPC